MNSQRPATPPSQKAAVRLIIQEAAGIFDVPATGIIGLSRKRHLCRARQAVCRVAWEQGWSSAEIARRLSGRDHTTVIHARKQVDIHHPRDPNFAERFNRLSDRAAALKGQGYA